MASISLAGNRGLMNHPNPERMWECFLRIGESASFNTEKGASASPEESDKAAREAALAALKHIKEDVLPFVRRMQAKDFIDWYCFLIHDRESGAPVEDDGAYVHLRVALSEKTDVFVPTRWVGSDWKCTCRMVCPPHEVDDWRILGMQSEIVLAVIERYKDLDGIALLQQLGQSLHYFANMVQLPFPRPTWMT